MELTLEQKEQWQRTTLQLVLGVMEGYEMTSEGLTTSAERLAASGVPSWAIQLRNQCISAGEKEQGIWVPAFALRSESALVGLQVLSRGRSESRQAYCRVLLNFLLRVFEPFACCPRIAELRQLCGSSEMPQSEWRKMRRALIQQLQEPETLLRGWQADCCLAAHWSVAVAQLALFARPQKANATESRLIEAFTHLNRWPMELLSHSRSEPRIERRARTIQPVADAYLAALEAECPTPEWLRENASLHPGA